MTDQTTITKGQRLIELLQAYGVETVFGIPGVHTVELYRGLASSNINHITPRHEQGAGFMADGYARTTGKPGVCFVITGPGLTNIATAMGQALADSIPMLVISTVNPAGTEGMGCLHAMPTQQAMIKPLTVAAFELNRGDDIDDIVDQVFAALSATNGTKLGPVHLQIPLDLMGQKWVPTQIIHPETLAPVFPLFCVGAQTALSQAANLLNQSTKTVILAGGGAIKSQAQIQTLAEKLDAPVVTTINGRGLMANHPLSVPASPSLDSVRALLAAADCILALGTEMGQTDYDMNVNGQFPILNNLIRVDINPAVIGNTDQLGIHTSVCQALEHLLPVLTNNNKSQSQTGATRALQTRQAAVAELPPNYQLQHQFLQCITKALPNAIIVGDSTQPIYAGNCYFEANAPGHWFNSATGFGTLGYAVPAAIGAALGLQTKPAQTKQPIIAITGDGGLQFCLSELATAKDTQLPIIYIVWNNHGYGEIETSMRAVGVTPVGVSPQPPLLPAIAQAYGLGYQCITDTNDLMAQLQVAANGTQPVILEIIESDFMIHLSQQ